MTPWYTQTWAWAAGAGVVVLLALLGLFGRRRKTPADAAEGSSSSLADRFVPPPAAGASAAGDTEQDELLDQLAERPDDVGLHLELVTLYYSRRDVDHFEAAAEAMHAHIADPQQDEWQDVVHMGEDLVPGHPLFDHHVEPPARSGEDPLEGFDIDDYADAPTAAGEAAPAANLHLADSPKPVGGYAFDFDLTTHPDLPPTAPAAESAPDTGRVSTPAPAADSSPAMEPEMDDAAASTWEFAEPVGTPAVPAADDLGEFNDDPVDTKLDLARAYLDMGDAEGARAMLDEVIKEGSQMQQDVARGLLGGLPH
jgi:pilus assembly protein FimV